MTGSATSQAAGPLRVSANGRHFVDHTGQPFFWLGDTQWQLLRDFSLPDVELILANRQAKGFNVIQVMVTGVGDGTRPNLEGQLPWHDNNPAMPNEAYFARADRIVELAQTYGQTLMLYLCHNTQRNYVTTQNARAYAHWVAQRYRNAPNVMWAFVTEVPIADHLPIIHELAAGVQSGDGGTHLITYHPDPVRPALSSGEIHTEPWLAFNTIQTWAYFEGIWGMVTRDYARPHPKPVVMAEGAYEDETSAEYSFVITPLLARQQAYWSYLAGGFHSYGHTNNWKVAPGWQDLLDAPGAFQMGLLKQIFCARDWWNLVPDQSLIAGQPIPGSTLNTAARAADGTWGILYLSRPATISLHLGKLGNLTSSQAHWVDPRNGSLSGAIDLREHSTPVFSTPQGWEDSILVIE
jgi:hypothetical protein